jgi:hypothetical protein
LLKTKPKDIFLANDSRLHRQLNRCPEAILRNTLSSLQNPVNLLWRNESEEGKHAMIKLLVIKTKPIRLLFLLDSLPLNFPQGFSEPVGTTTPNQDGES